MHLSKKSWIICIIAAIILAVVFGGIFSVNFTKAGKIKESIKLGNKYLEEGNYEEAILAFEETIEIEPKNIDARVNLAKAYVNLKDYDKAEAALKEAISIDTNNNQPKEELIKLYILRGKEFLTSQKYQEAQNYFYRAIDFYKSRSDTYITIASYYEESIITWNDAKDILNKGYTETQNKDIKIKLEELQNKITASNIYEGKLTNVIGKKLNCVGEGSAHPARYLTKDDYLVLNTNGTYEWKFHNKRTLDFDNSSEPITILKGTFTLKESSSSNELDIVLSNGYILRYDFKFGDITEYNLFGGFTVWGTR